LADDDIATPSTLIPMLGAAGGFVTFGDGLITNAAKKSVKSVEVVLRVVYVHVVELPGGTDLVALGADSVNSPLAQGSPAGGGGVVGVVVGGVLGDAEGAPDADGSMTDGAATVAVRDDASATLIDRRARSNPAAPEAINVRGRMCTVPRFGHEVDDRPYQS
jgi:hypothetical protein